MIMIMIMVITVMIMMMIVMDDDYDGDDGDSNDGDDDNDDYNDDDEISDLDIFWSATNSFSITFEGIKCKTCETDSRAFKSKYGFVDELIHYLCTSFIQP